MKPLEEENLPIRLYYSMVNRVGIMQTRAVSACKALNVEIDNLLRGLDNDLLRLKGLEARMQAIEQCYVIPDVIPSIYQDSDPEIAIMADGFRKTEEYETTMQMIAWLQTQGIACGETVTEERFLELRELLDNLLTDYCYVSHAIETLQLHLWRLEGHIALAAGYRVDSGLSWNLTGKAPYTKTDFENLMSALWEQKFITHTSGKKEHAMRALYGIFGLPVPEKPGTNRAKAKASGTTSDNSLEIFDRLKRAHQKYLDTEVR